MADGSLPDNFDWKHPDYSAVYRDRAERLKRLREDRDLLASVFVYYSEHPADFINDWGMTSDARMPEIGLPAEMPFILFPKQREMIDWLHDRWRNRQDGIVEKSRDMGASWLCVAFAVWMWIFKPGTNVGFGSRKEDLVDRAGDPGTIFWKIRKFIELLPKEFVPVGYVERVHAPFMKVMNKQNASTIIGESGDDIGRGNRTSIYFKDESSHYERPEKIEAALSATSNCKIDVSTPNGTGNPFYRKRKSGQFPVMTLHWKDDPRKGPEWYEKQLRLYDPVIVAQEIDINYEASVTDAFIPASLVDAAMANGPADVEAKGPVIWGLDVARFGDDSTRLVQRRGRVAYVVQTWRQMDTQFIGNEVWRLVGKQPHGVQQIAVDDIGVGGGVTDLLRSLASNSKTEIVAVNSAIRVDDGYNYNLRTKMWDDMKAWLADAPVSLGNDADLKSEWTALRYSFKPGNLRLLEAKADAKKRGIKSPDIADALALTFAKPVSEVEQNLTLNFKSQWGRGRG